MKSEREDTKDRRLTFPRINLAKTKLSPRKSSHPYQWYSWKYNAVSNGENTDLDRVGKYTHNDIGGLTGRGSNNKRNDKRNHLILDTQSKNNESNRLSTSSRNYQRLVKSTIQFFKTDFFCLNRRIGYLEP